MKRSEWKSLIILQKLYLQLAKFESAVYNFIQFICVSLVMYIKFYIKSFFYVKLFFFFFFQ